MVPPVTTRGAQRFVIGRVDDFVDGEHVVVEVNGRSIGVFRYGGRYFALLNRCPHQGGPLCAGPFGPLIDSDGVGSVTLNEDRVLVSCPWHGWEFDIRDGQSYCDPKRFRVRPYPVDVESGSSIRAEIELGKTAPAGQLVKGPFRAEVVPIEVEDEYVVVQLR